MTSTTGASPALRSERLDRLHLLDRSAFCTWPDGTTTIEPGAQHRHRWAATGRRYARGSRLSAQEQALVTLLVELQRFESYMAGPARSEVAFDRDRRRIAFDLKTQGEVARAFYGARRMTARPIRSRGSHAHRPGHRRTSSSSTTSSADPPGDGEPHQPLSPWHHERHGRAA